MAAVSLREFIAQYGQGIEVKVLPYEKNGRKGIYLWTSHQIQEFDRNTGEKMLRRFVVSIANSITEEFVKSRPQFLHEVNVIPMKGGGFCVVHPSLQGEKVEDNSIASATF